MAKQGVVKIDADGVTTFVEGSGAIKMLANATTTLYSSTEQPVGYAAFIQKAMIFAAGNAVGVHSTTGRLGIGALGRNMFIGQ